MYKMIVTPNPILIQIAEPVKSFDKKLESILSGMKETLLATTDPKGVGLAAPQVGLPLRIFLAKPTDKAQVSTYINPVIEKTSVEEGILHHTNSARIERAKPKKSRGKLLEGCLSIPNIWGNVTRKKEVTLVWQDATGKKHKKKFKGFMATVIQHEVDHLNGILFTKYVIEQNEKLYKSHKNEEGEDEFDEVNI